MQKITKYWLCQWWRSCARIRTLLMDMTGEMDISENFTNMQFDFRIFDFNVLMK